MALFFLFAVLFLPFAALADGPATVFYDSRAHDDDFDGIPAQHPAYKRTLGSPDLRCHQR